MFSTLTERGASATLDALSAGANEYVTKPANVGSVGQSMESVREQLIPKIKALTGRPVTVGPARAAARSPPRPAAPRTGPGKKPAVLVIGSSTGGPEALAKVLPQLPAVAAGAGAARPAHAAGLHPPVRPAAGPALPPPGRRGLRRQPAAARHGPPRSRRPPPRGAVHRSGPAAPASTRGRPRTSADPRSIPCSAPPSPPSTAPSSASCSPAWGPTAATAPVRSAPPAAPSSCRTRPPRSCGACPARSARPASPTRCCPSTASPTPSTATCPASRPARAGAVLSGGAR